MWRCPYCRSEMRHPVPDELPMSHKRREIYNFIVNAGPRGVEKVKVIDKFFAACESETVLRTTIHYINKTIQPQKINSRGGIIRLILAD